MQANSAGSMLSCLNLLRVMSSWVRAELREGGRSGSSLAVKSVGDGRGRHHWIEQRRNSSDQLSSRSKT